jgi:hypothetical protein
MDETFRMLGREHQADLEREVQNRRLAAVARKAPPRETTQAGPRPRRWRLGLFARLKAA